VHLDDIGVAQARHSPGFSLKTLLEPLFGDKFGSDYFQSPMNGQARVKGFVHIGHTAPPQALDNLVLPQGLSYEISHIITPISLTDNNRLNFFLPALCIIS
jgi:hypothetical protein